MLKNDGKKTVVDFEEVNGKTLVRRKEYYATGQLFCEGTYSKSGRNWGWDLPVGTLKTYFDNGKLQTEEQFNKNGDLHGERKTFDREGNLTKTQIYEESKLLRELLHTKSPER